MNWDDVAAACQLALTAIIGAVAAYVVKFINRRTEALDYTMKRDAAFDAASRIEARVQAGDNLTSAGKLHEALKLANETTPERLEVKPADIEAALPRVRASLQTPSSLPPLAMSAPSHVPPAPLTPREFTERDTSREKAPLR